MTKKELRKKYKLLRQELSKNQIEDYSMAIANQLLKLNIWNYNFYHIFLSIENQNEINTEPILNILAGKDKHIVIPKTNFEDYQMTHYLLTDNIKIKKNSCGIPEPVEGIEINPLQIDIVFVPLLAFDKKGNRIGYGKGFYDRFLQKCKTNTIKIGLSYFNAETKVFDTHNNDVKLEYCITPKRVFNFLHP